MEKSRFVKNVLEDFFGLSGEVVGSEYQACCPFHNERRPSFGVKLQFPYPYNCFACGAKGKNILGMFRGLKGMSEASAKSFMAKYVDFNFDNSFVEEQRITKEFFGQYTRQAKIYRKMLIMNVVSDKKNALRKFLKKKRLAAKVLLNCGVGYSEKTKELVFPMVSIHHGVIMGFNFRNVETGFKKIQENMAKAKSVFATPWFSNASILFVVEGPMDLLRIVKHIDFFAEYFKVKPHDIAVFALMGVLITEHTLPFIVDYPKIVWGFDNDKGGDDAYRRVSKLNLKSKQYVLTFDGLDPAKSNSFNVESYNDVKPVSLPGWLT